MKTIETLLTEENKRIQSIIKETDKRLQNVPKGRLRISNKKTHREYYYIDKEHDERNNGRYLKTTEKELAGKIAQRDYDTALIKNLAERRNAIELFLSKYKKNGLDTLYEKTNIYRRELLKTVYVSDEEYIRQWQRVQYKGKEFFDNIPFFMTERGEKVRSKSEKIIADKLYAMGIPYRYECPLVLNDDIIVYPDFTNGIYMGVNLFFTYETSKRPLNTKVLKEMFKSLFYTE